MAVDTEAIVTALRRIATALDLLGEGSFRARAFARGAESVEALGPRLSDLRDAGRLTEVPGIGRALAAQIQELAETGASSYLQALEARLPPGALALAEIPGMSLAAIRKLSDVDVRDRSALERALETGSLVGRRGFGPKTLDRLRRQLAAPASEARSGRPLVDALEAAEWLGETLRAQPAIGRVELAGAARRNCEVVGEVVLVVETDDSAAVASALERNGRVGPVERRDDGAWHARLANGLALKVHSAPTARFGVALQRCTGSVEHGALLEEVAVARGLRLEPQALRRGTELVPVADERALYALLGVAYVPPPLREADEPLSQSERRLVRARDVRGLVHCHTTYSDGRASIEEMAHAAQAGGFEYVTITDHSPTASYAGGLTVERLKRQWDEIAAVQERVGIRILRGTESDILRDGALDYPDEILERLDVIIASIHNRYQLDRAATTDRIVRAMRHPLFKIWGHALGRILERRPPVDCDHDAVLDAVASSRVAVELNGDPWRMDMPPAMAKRARALGVRFVISVDAHSVQHRTSLELGVGMAQRAGLEAGDVLNTLAPDDFVSAVRAGLTTKKTITGAGSVSLGGRTWRAPRHCSAPASPRTHR